MLSLTADSFSGGVLTVDFDNADSVSITSSGGNVLVNGANPTTGPAAAASVTAINITGTGSFDNTIDLSGVSAAQGFISLATVAIAAGGAVSGDSIVLGPLNSSGAVIVSSSGPSQITLAAGFAAGSLAISPGSLSDIYLDGNVTTSGAQSYGAPVWLEADTLLAAGSGNITFGSTLDGAHNLTVNSSGTTTFSGIVGGTTPPSSLTTDAAGSTVIDASINASGLTLNNPVTLGGNATLAAGLGTVSVNNAIDGAYALSITGFDEALTGAIGSNTPLASLYIDVPFTSTFSGGSITTTGYQTYDTDLTLGADTSFNAGSSTLDFESGLNGSYNVAFNTSGLTDLAGTLGGDTPLASVTTDAAGTTILDSVTTTGNQTYNAPVTLGGATLNAGSGNIVFKSTVDGGSLTTDTTGTATFDGALGANSALSSLTTDAGGTTVLAGGSINTTFGITFNNFVLLGSNMSIANSGFAIEFNGTVDGDYSLSVGQSGFPGTTFAAAVGGITPLASLTSTGNGTLSLQSVSTTGAQTYSNSTVDLDGTYDSQLGTVTVDDSATLLGQTSLDAGGALTLNQVNGAFGLELVSSGSIVLEGLIGNSTPLASLEAAPDGSLTIDNTITTTGAQAYSVAPYRASGVLFDAGGGVTFNPGPPILTPVAPALPSMVVNQSASTAETVSTIVSSSIATAFATGIAITGVSSPGGNWQYSLNGTTWTNFGAVSNTNSLLLDEADSVRFVPDGVDTGTATFTYRAWDESDGNNPGTFADTSTNGGSTGFSTATDTASIGVQAAAALTTDTFAAGVLTINIVGSQNVTITSSGGYVLVNGANPTTGAAAAGAVTAISIVATGNSDNVIDLTGVSAALGFVSLATVSINAGGSSSGDQVKLGALNASGAVSVTGTGGDAVSLPASLTAGSVSISATTINLDSVTTTGNQTYTGAVAVSGNATVSAGSGNVTFDGSVDGGYSLTVDSSGVTTFAGAVGSNSQLASLTTDAGGSTVIESSVASGAITINDPLTLGGNVTLAGNFDTIEINSTIDGAFGLTINAWGLTLAGAIGSITPLTTLSISSGFVEPTFSGGSITTTGQQTYDSDLILEADTTFSAGSSEILIQSGLDGFYNAIFNTSGLTDFANNLGSTMPLASVTTDAAGTTTVDGSVTTAGNQTYNGPVTVSTFTTFNAGSGDITFKSTVSGNSLTTNTSGTTTFSAPIGGNSSLSSLTTDSGGTTVLEGGYYSATSTMTFDNAVVLGANTVMVTPTFSITFGGTVDGAYSLTVGQNGSGGADLGAVGSITPLASLTTLGGFVSLGDVTTTGSQDYASGTVNLHGLYTTATGSFSITGSTTLLSNTVINAGGAINLGTVNGAYGLNIIGAAVTTLGGTVGSNAPLGSITIDSADGVYIAGNVTTGGNQTYSVPVVAALGATLSSASGTVSEVASIGTAPMLTPIAPLLAPVAINQANSSPIQVSAMVGNSITDENGLYGIAVSAQSSPGGSWQYSLNGGANWTNFGSVSGSQALLLAPTDLVEFVPDGVDTGTATFTYRAWNETSGVAGTQVNTTISGGNTAFSTATDTASIGVQVAAAITTDTFSGGVLTVDVDGAEDVTITSSGGHVLVNGASPTTGAASASAVTAIDVTASAGPYSNIINLNGVSSAEGFTALATVAINTGGSYGSFYEDIVHLGTLNASGLVSVTGTGTDSVSTAEPLVAGSLSITATSVGLYSVTTTGSQTYNSAVNVNTSIATLTAGSGNVTFNGTISGAGQLIINSSGVTTFNAAVGTTALSELTIDAAGSTVLNASINAEQINFNNPVTLGTNVTLGNGANSGIDDNSVNIKNTIDGAYALSIDARTILLSGAIGSSTPLASVNLASQGGFPLSSGVTFGGGSITTIGPQTFDAELTLSANAMFNAGSSTILVEGGMGGNYSATFDTSGLTDITAIVGQFIELGSLTVDAAGTTTLSADVITTGNQTYNNPVTIGTSAGLLSDAGSVTFNSTVDGGSLTVNASGPTTFNAAIGKTTPLAYLYTYGKGTTVLAGGFLAGAANIAFNNAVVLGSDMSIVTGEGATFGGTVDGDYSLSVSESGSDPSSFAGAVGGITPLASLSTTGGALSLKSVSTTGAQTYDDPAVQLDGLYSASGGSLNIETPGTLLGNVVINAAGAVTLDTINGAYPLNIVSGGLTTLGGQIGNLEPLASLTVISTDGVDINANVTTTGNQIYSLPPVTVGPGVNLTSTAGTVSQVGSVNTAPLLTPVGPILPAVSVNESGSVPTAVATMVGNSITDDDGLYGIAVVSQSSPGGSWQYSLDNGTTWTDFGAVSASQSLLLGPTDLVRLAPDGADMGAATFTYRAWNLNTGSAGTLADTTTNGDDTAFSTGTDTASTIVQIAPVIMTDTFSGGVLTVDVDGPQDVSISESDGLVLVNGANPSTGAADANAVTAIDITASAGNYDNIINLQGVSAAIGFTALATVSIDTGGSYSGDQVELGELDASGLVSVTGTGSDTVTPWSLVAGSVSITSTTVDLGFNVTTTGDQTYNANVTLPAAATLSAGSGNITFNGTVDGGWLTTKTTGTTTFNGALGKMTPLEELTTDGGTTVLAGGSIAAVESVTFNNPVLLDSDLAITAEGNTLPAISFNSSVDGAFDLLAESDGTIDFAGAVGANIPLASLTTEGYSSAGAGLVEIGAPINTVGAQTYNQPVQLQSAGSISEEVSLAAGTYAVEFQAAQGSSTGAPQNLQFSVDGSSAGSIAPAASTYAAYSSTVFVAAAGTENITIVSNPTDSGNSLLLKDISIQMADGADQDFEIPSVGSGTWQYGPAGTPWTFTGTAGISGNSSGITAGNAPAPQGSQVAFVQETGSMSETVGMSAGTYTLDFLAAQRENYNHGGQSLQVLVDGTPVGSSITPAGSSYALYGSASFTVSTGTHTITIEGLDPNGQDNTALVDAISIQPVTANQLADPDFSDASVSSGHWQYAPADSAWYFFGTAGVSGNYSGITAGNALAPQGSQVGFVQETGSMSQAVSFSAGTYAIQFQAAQRGNYNFGGQTLQISIDGVPVSATITPAGADYTLVTTATFAVTSGTHVISIAGLDPEGGDNTALIDAVSIVPVYANQAADPNFAAVAVAAGTWQYAPAGSPWTFTGTAGVSGNYSGITAGNPVAPAGSQAAFVQETGSISQVIGMSAGTYTLSFLAAQRENYNHGGQSLEVLVDGSPVSGDITPAGSSYLTYSSAAFTVTAGMHTLEILGLDPSGQDNTALIDSVSLAPATASQVADPDFAAVTVSPGTWQYAPAGSTWTFTGTGGVSGNYSGITAGNSTAPQGSQVAFVQETGTMTQVVGMSAGTYTLDFLSAQRENYNHGGQVLQVLVDGSPVGGTITPAGSSYALYGSATFSVTAGIHTITIEGLDPSGQDNTALVDGVSIQPVTTGQVADPEFSDANVGSGNWQYAPADSAWYFLGTAGVTGNSSSITNVAAPQGNQAGFVEQTGSISQVVSLAAGTYTLQFDAAQAENSSSGGQTLQVSIDGVPVGGSITPAGANYALVTTATFTVGAGTHVISIAGLDPQGGDVTALVNAVAIAVQAT